MDVLRGQKVKARPGGDEIKTSMKKIETDEIKELAQFGSRDGKLTN